MGDAEGRNPLGVSSTTEQAIVRVVAIAQFINVLEFVIVMPLGPDFALALGVPVNELSFVAASYTAAAAIVGILGAFFLDRFDRRSALLVTLSGLVVSTASAGFAHSFHQLLVSRALAGAFGGPATSVAMSIVADAVPEARRGRAFSTVMLAFSIASIFGLPAGLELAQHLGWRAPFFAIALLGVGAVALTTRLPPLTAHLARAEGVPPLRALGAMVARPTVRASYLMTLALQMSGFLIIPSISPYLQFNVHFPRRWLGALYFAGGIVSLGAIRAAGRLVNRHGSLRVGTAGLGLLSIVVLLAFVRTPPLAWVPLLFCCYMLAQGFRNVAYNTLASKVPASHERARFQSLQSAVTHIAISLGAAIAARLLSTAPDGTLVGMARVSWLAIAVSALVPLFMWRVERVVAARSPADANA